MEGDMANNIGAHPGAIWHKTDLQCHSPRDRGWGGSPDLPGNTPADLDARAGWAKEFVAACAAKNISAVAVTDHHDAAMVPYVQQAARDAGHDLVVFPGIEITCDDNAQCLALFDPSSDGDVWERLLNKLPNVQRAAATDRKGCIVNPCGLTVEKLFKVVAEDSVLRDACLLIPHFSGEDAHKSLNEQGHHPRFANLPANGVYIERSFDQLDETTVKKIHGLITEWGDRRRAIIATGDNRKATWDRLGAHSCWIKLGETTIEGLRQALLADEARISYQLPDVPSERVLTLTVKSTLTGKDPVEISFNDGFTALIGGRGSGKSSILEYLWFALGRRLSDTPSSKGSLLVEETLGADGFATVKIEREGVIETWTRKLAKKDVISITDCDGNVNDISLDEARRRFRARAFYQKDLSSTTVDEDSDTITGIAAAEAIEKRREVDQQIKNAKRSVGVALQQAAAYWQSQLEKKQASLRVKDIQDRITATAKRLDEEGVSKETLEILAQAPGYVQSKRYIEDLQALLADESRVIEGLKQSILPLPTLGKDATFEEAVKLRDAADASRKRVVDLLTSLSDELKTLEQARLAASTAYEARATTYREKYQAGVKQQDAHKTLLHDSTRLTEELGGAQAAESRAQARESELAPARAALQTERDALSALLMQRRKILGEAADKVAGDSSQVLKARVKNDARQEELIEAVLALLQGSRVHDAEQKTEELVGRAMKPGAAMTWQDFTAGMVCLYRDRILAGLPDEPTDAAKAEMEKLLFNGEVLTVQQARKIYSSLTDSKISALLSAVSRDQIILTYVDDGNQIPFSKASPGQQASALLELLLRQEAGPLMIDQPEDDLDNKVLMSIVQLIRTSKNRRQLIFTTHNPNILVNGDADKVIALKSRGESPMAAVESPRISIKHDGVIETPDIRETITHIMEGGKAAFDLRSRKYRFDLE